MRTAIVFLALILTLPYHTEGNILNSPSYSYNNFDNNRFTTKEQKKLMRPYLLPADHPLRQPLDAIFHKSRATENEETLKAAGFRIVNQGSGSGIIVASHPTLPGVLLKIYLDSHTHHKHQEPGWLWLLRRCQGAEKVRRAIKECNSHHFTVPDKWIYPLPMAPSPKKRRGSERKNELLVVTDMRLTPENVSLAAWKNEITEEHLDQFYAIITRAGGSSYRADNVAYTQKGTFAFIDTEYPYKEPNYSKITPYLSPPMCCYWEKLVAQQRGKAAGQPRSSTPCSPPMTR